MTIEVFGAGCAACMTMKANVERAVKELGLDCPVQSVTRIVDMIERGITATPTLVVDGQVRCEGRALDVEAIKALLTGGAAQGEKHQ